jgi:hypothetical protein
MLRFGLRINASLLTVRRRNLILRHCSQPNYLRWWRWYLYYARYGSANYGFGGETWPRISKKLRNQTIVRLNGLLTIPSAGQRLKLVVAVSCLASSSSSASSYYHTVAAGKPSAFRFSDQWAWNSLSDLPPSAWTAIIDKIFWFSDNLQNGRISTLIVLPLEYWIRSSVMTSPKTFRLRFR